jgi:hypothetical protein
MAADLGNVPKVSRRLGLVRREPPEGLATSDDQQCHPHA